MTDDCGMSGRVEWEAEFHQPLAHWCWEVWWLPAERSLDDQSYTMYSVFVFCLSPPEECLSSFWFRSRTFLGEPGLTESGNVNLVTNKFPRDNCGPPFGPRRGIPAQEGEHVPCAEDHLLFC